MVSYPSFVPIVEHLSHKVTKMSEDEASKSVNKTTFNRRCFRKASIFHEPAMFSIRLQNRQVARRAFPRLVQDFPGKAVLPPSQLHFASFALQTDVSTTSEKNRNVLQQRASSSVRFPRPCPGAPRCPIGPRKSLAPRILRANNEVTWRFGFWRVTQMARFAMAGTSREKPCHIDACEILCGLSRVQVLRELTRFFHLQVKCQLIIALLWTGNEIKALRAILITW